MTEHLVRPVYTPDDERTFADLVAWADSLVDDALVKHAEVALLAMVAGQPETDAAWAERLAEQLVEFGARHDRTQRR